MEKSEQKKKNFLYKLPLYEATVEICEDEGDSLLLFFWWIAAISIVAALLGSASCVSCDCRLEGYDGSMKAHIIDVEDVDFVTWDNTMALVKSSPEASTSWNFCVGDEAVKKDLLRAMNERIPVTIYYYNDFIMWRWECNGGVSIITRVDFGGDSLEKEE